MATDLTALTDDQVRAVRDDRSALTDDVYKILEATVDGLTLRSAVFGYLAAATTEATTETIERIERRLRA